MPGRVQELRVLQVRIFPQVLCSICAFTTTVKQHKEQKTQLRVKKKNADIRVLGRPSEKGEG